MNEMDGSKRSDALLSPEGKSEHKVRHSSYSDMEDMLRKNGRWRHSVSEKFFAESSEGQNPTLFFIGCSDSRVPESVILNTLKPGEIFTFRNVGNYINAGDTSFLAALEYAVEVLRVSRIVVCGHTRCGGITAACEYMGTMDSNRSSKALEPGSLLEQHISSDSPNTDGANRYDQADRQTSPIDADGETNDEANNLPSNVKVLVQEIAEELTLALSEPQEDNKMYCDLLQYDQDQEHDQISRVEFLVKVNVLESVRKIADNPLVKKALEKESLEIFAALYHLEDGRLQFLNL